MGTVIVILGGHRTGSSLISGILHHLGVNMGQRFRPPDSGNKTGYWEDLDFEEIHKKIVLNWQCPRPNFKPHAVEYAKLMKEKLIQPLWGVKDPKLCFCFNEFSELATGHDVKVITTHRDPEAVAKSILSVRFIPRCSSVPPNPTATHELYEKARAQALDNFKGQRLNINYDLLIHDIEPHVQKIADFAGVPITADALKFVDKNLNHYAKNRGDLFFYLTKISSSFSTKNS